VAQTGSNEEFKFEEFGIAVTLVALHKMAGEPLARQGYVLSRSEFMTLRLFVAIPVMGLLSTLRTVDRVSLMGVELQAKFGMVSRVAVTPRRNGPLQ